MNAVEPILPKEQQEQEIKEYFVSSEWLSLKAEIEKELEDFKDFILDDSTVGTDIDTSYSKMLQLVNEYVCIFKEKFRIEHIQTVLQRFIIEDNDRKRLYTIGSDRPSMSARDVMRYKCKMLRYFLSFEKVYEEKNGQDKTEDDNTDEGGLNPLWEGIGISSQTAKL